MMYRKLLQLGKPDSRLHRQENLIDSLWVFGLLLAALILYLINLGNLPLRDWDEGIVAQVAREIYQAPAGSLRWLYPTLGGEAYINKPPLVHWLIAWAYSLGDVNEWTTRLPGAILAAISIPLLYKIGREIFPCRLYAIFAALIYLTLLPVVRHGRLAMLDGAVLCFFLFAIWCLLRSRRDLRYCLGAGIGFGLICLTKGILGLLLGAIALLFVAWDTPRLLKSVYFWGGIIIGSIPVGFWYGAQVLHYGQTFISAGLVDQSFKRLWTPLENHAGPPWYYLLEIIKYNWPWLLFLPQSLIFTWENRNLSWAKLVLVWSGAYFLTISLMTTKLPWYVMPIYPALALAIGAYLAEVWYWPSTKAYPRAWSPILGLLALVSWVGSIYFGKFIPELEADLQMVMVAIAITMSLAAFLVAQRDFQFIPILLWGSYVSLSLLMISDDWIWELAEHYPVKPVAEIIQRIPANQKIYTSHPYFRPSLNFYSDRQVIPSTPSQLKQYWEQEPNPYLLLDREALQNLKLERVKTRGAAAGWTLITRDN